MEDQAPEAPEQNGRSIWPLESQLKSMKRLIVLPGD